MHTLFADIGHLQASYAQSMTAKGRHHGYAVHCQHCHATQTTTVLQMNADMLKQPKSRTDAVDQKCK